MKKAAIIFASHHGQTRNIARAIREQLTQEEVPVDVLEISRRLPLPALDPDVDTIFVGAPVYAGGFPRQLIRWVRDHKAALAKTNWAFFSVSLNAADQRPQARRADDRAIRKFIAQVGLVPAYVASLGGALNYPGYGWILRTYMKRASSEANGPTDTSRDHQLTNWGEVSGFTEAVVKLNRNSPFATQRRFPLDQRMDEQMPQFEQFSSTEIVIHRPPSEVFSALSSLEAGEMKLANFLTKIRTLGRAETPPHESFMVSAERFGNVPLFNDGIRELGAGLVGKFWELDFGIRRLKPGEFKDFQEPGYAKVASNFLVEPIPGTNESRVISKMRVHCTSSDATRKFKVYWALLSPGIRLYMRSALQALRRRAERGESKLPPKTFVTDEELHHGKRSEEKRLA
ncbi:MAG: flavodoxin domain-containing protein [Bdellovibrionota bacterium]